MKPFPRNIKFDIAATILTVLIFIIGVHVIMEPEQDPSDSITWLMCSILLGALVCLHAMFGYWKLEHNRAEKLELAFRDLMRDSLIYAAQAAGLAMQFRDDSPRLLRAYHAARQAHIRRFLRYATDLGVSWEEVIGMIENRVDIRVLRDVVLDRVETGEWGRVLPPWCDQLAAAVNDEKYYTWDSVYAPFFEKSLQKAGLGSQPEQEPEPT